MNNKIASRLKYYSEKLKYAETNLYGEKAVNMIKACKAMIDLHLDQALELEKIKV